MTKKTLTILIIAAAGIVVVLFLILGRGADDGAGESGFLSRFFPTGGQTPIEPRPLTETPPEDDLDADLISQRAQAELIQLTQTAVSGATFINEKIRYIEKSTGHLYEMGPDGEEKNRLSNTTIPSIFEVIWSKNASSSILRILDESGNKAKNFAASFDGSSTQGIFITQEITSITSSPEQNKIFYIFPSGSKSIGIQADFENKNQKEIINTPFGEFLADWPEKNTLALLTKPSGLAEGFLYKFDLKKNAFRKLLGGMKGLTAKLSPDAEKVVYSESAPNGLATSIWDISESRKINLNIKTLAEKCIFSNISENIIYCAVPVFLPSKITLPDDWYQGNISFSDRIWQIDIKTGESKILMDNTNNLDIIDIILSPKENYILFTNKKDATLWRLRLATSD
jgi:hypothetical protein